MQQGVIERLERRLVRLKVEPGEVASLVDTEKQAVPTEVGGGAG